MNLTEALKDDTTYTFLEWISGACINPPVRRFFLEWKPKEDWGIRDHELNKKACKHLIEGGGAGIVSLETVKTLQGALVQDLFGYLEIALRLTRAYEEATKNAKPWLETLNKGLASISTRNQANVKSSQDGQSLKAALVGKYLVIGDKDDLFHNHQDLKAWLLRGTKANPQAEGTLKVKKGKGLSAGSLTAEGGLKGYASKIAPLVAEFSKKKII